MLSERLEHWEDLSPSEFLAIRREAAAKETALKDAEEQIETLREGFVNAVTIARERGETLITSEIREAGLREAFETASQRVSVGRVKRLMFKCMHCEKDTPLMIDGLLDLANKALAVKEAHDAE